MGERGPQTTKLKTVAPKKKRRPTPLPGMDPAARRVWLRIVNAYPPGRFKPQHYDQLRAYCEASAIHKEARTNLMKSTLLVKQPNGVIKENPYIGILDKMAARIQGLAVKLGISVNNTTVARGDGGEATKPKSKRAGLILNG